MSTRQEILHSEVYTQFNAIDKGDYYKQIRFVRKHSNTFQELDLDECIEILQAYREALFQTGKYSEHIVIAEELAAMSITYNIFEFGGEDLFYDSLLQKAASHHHLEEYDKAISVLEQLIRINPEHEAARFFLFRSVIAHQKEKRTMVLRGLAIAMFLISAGLVALDLLVIKPFFEMYSRLGTASYQAFFLGGVVLLIFDEVQYRAKGVGSALRCIKQARRHK